VLESSSPDREWHRGMDLEDFSPAWWRLDMDQMGEGNLHWGAIMSRSSLFVHMVNSSVFGSGWKTEEDRVTT
jgi:hypothetical protein